MPPKKGSKYRPRQPKPSPQLEAMRWVLANAGAETGDPLRTDLLAEYRKSPLAFVRQVESMEARLSAKGGPEEAVTVPSGTVAGPDEGTVRVQELIDQLLRDLGVTA